MTFPNSNGGINPPEQPGLPGGNTPTFTPPLPNANDPNSGALADNNTSSSDISVVNDQLANLLELVFDGTPFPAVAFSEHGSQDLAIHKYPNLDSARIENTGRNPSVFDIRGIFTNNIYPSNNESWISGTLFPTTFNLVLQSLYDTTKPIKILVHPYLGNISVAVQNWKFEFIGKGPRDGVFLDITMVETIPQNNIGATISPPNNGANLSNIAGILDTLIPGYGIPIDPPGMSLGGFFSQLSSTISAAVAAPGPIVASLQAPIFSVQVGIQQVGLAVKQGLAQYSNQQYTYNVNSGNAYNVANVNSGQPSVNYSIEALQLVYGSAAQLNTAQHNNSNQLINASLAFLNNMINYYNSMNNNATALITLTLYQMINQLQLMQASLYSNNNQYSVQRYTTQSATTIMSLCNILNNTVDQLLSLNPTLNQTLLIPGNTPISYYQS